MGDARDWLKDVIIGPTKQGEERYLNYFGMVFWGLFVAALGVALFSGIVNLWPVVDVTPAQVDAGDTAAQATKAAQDAQAALDEKTNVEFLWGIFSLDLDKSTGLIVLAILAGGLGGWASAARLFAFWAGQRKLKSTWAWWFGNRVMGGAALALIVYLMIRGGLFGSQDATDEINAYGTAAFAGLVGLFNRQAMDKLQEVFLTLFRSGQASDDEDAGEAAALDQGQPTPKDVKESQTP